MEDGDDFWDWLQKGLAGFLEMETDGKVKADSSQIVTADESAGGYLSLLLELDDPDQIRALMAAYPSVYIRNSYFMEVVENMLLRVLMLPASIVTEHVAGVKLKEMAVGRW